MFPLGGLQRCLPPVTTADEPMAQKPMAPKRKDVSMMAGITWPGQAAGLCRTSPGCPMLALLTSVLEGASVDMLARSELPPMADQTEIGSS